MSFKILVGVDGSLHSKQTLELLGEFPFAEPPELIVAYVCAVPELLSMGSEIPLAVHEMIKENRQTGQNLLEEHQAACRSWAKSVSTLLLDGHAAQELVEAAERNCVDLIAVGSHGRGRTGRFLLGSVSDQVARHAPCSVLIIRPDTVKNCNQFPSPIIIADDTSLQAAAALHRFGGFPLGDQRSVKLIRVVEPNLNLLGLGPGSPADRPVAEAKQHVLQSHARRSQTALQSATPNVTYQLAEGTQVASQILDLAAELQAELIVLGNTGKSGWERLLLGSTSIQVLHNAPCSVWIERIPQSRPA